ncbi:MAG: flagellar filament capping protein FliD [Pseudomonadales bacterium]
MASITSLGVGSGLDLESLITNLLTAERAPTESRLNLDEAKTQASISAYGSLKSTLVAFQDSLSDLKTTSFFSNRAATSGDSTILTATSESTAALSSFNIAVTALAQESKVTTNGNFADANATVGAGTLTIGFVGGSSFDVSVASTDSLTVIRDAINNATDNIGVTASLINISATETELVITSDNTGASNQIDISVDDTGDGNDTDALGLSRFHFDGADPGNLLGFNQADNSRTAQDATIVIDNITVTNSTNTFKDNIPGVTITAVGKSVDASTTTALTIGTDTSSVKSKVTTFAASYNELMIVLNTLTDVDAAAETRGILTGDANVRLIEQQVRRITTGVVEGAASNLSSLAFLGFETNSNGTVTLDTDDLNSALAANFDDFVTLFTGTDGVATKLDDLLDTFLDAEGTVPTREDTLKKQLSFIADERLDLERRLETIEARFRSQFAALDILISQLNNTGNFLLDQLAANAKIINRDK